MKKLFLLIAFPIIVSAQITTTKLKPTSEVPKVQYDSIQNFLGENAYGYLNQELYLPHLNEKLREYGWRDFDDDFPTSSIRGGYDYDELADKYFIVMKIDRAEYSFGDYIFTLKEKKKGKIYYFQYQPSFKHTFPFIVVGYYNKMKERYVGKDLFVLNKEKSSVFRCIDLTLDSVYFNLQLLLEKTNKEKKLFPFAFVEKPNFILFKEEADYLKQKYGEELWNAVLNNKIEIGMTKELCEVAWGKPLEINETIIEGKKSEQWVYLGNTYLYFENNLLAGIQK